MTKQGLIFGATGAVGRQLLDLCLNGDDYQQAGRPCPTGEQEVKNLKPVGILGLKYNDLIYNMSDVGFEQVADYGGTIKMLKSGRADYLAATNHPSTQKWANGLGVSLKICLRRPLLSLNGY